MEQVLPGGNPTEGGPSREALAAAAPPCYRYLGEDGDHIEPAVVANGEEAAQFKVNLNAIAKILVPVKLGTTTPAANGNVIVRDVLRAAGCDVSLLLASKQGPNFRRATNGRGVRVVGGLQGGPRGATYIHTYIHTCMHAYMHTYIHKCTTLHV